MRWLSVHMVLIGLSASLVHAGDGRIRLGAMDLPGTITNSGSYVLVESVVLTQSVLYAAIEVQADHVTIDLNGHSIVKEGGIGEHGIWQEPGRHGLRVRNGFLSGFELGIQAGNHARIEEVLFPNAKQVVHAGDGAYLRKVQASGLQIEYPPPISQLGDAAYVEGFHLLDGTIPLDGPSLWMNVGQASRVRDVQIRGISSDVALPTTVIAADRGSVLDHIMLSNLESANAATGIHLADGVLMDAHVVGLSSSTNAPTAIRLTRSLGARLTMSGLSGSSEPSGFFIQQTMMQNARLRGSFMGGNGFVERSRLVRTHVTSGRIAVFERGSVLRDNQVNAANDRAIILPIAGLNFAVRNTASGNPPPMFAVGVGNALSFVQEFPGGGFVITNNPWANIQH